MERAGELEPAGPVVHDGSRADTHSTRRRVREMLRAGHPFQVLPQAPKHLGQRLTGDSRLPLFGQHGAVDGHQPQFGPTATEIDTGAIHQSLYSLTACGPDCKRRHIGMSSLVKNVPMLTSLRMSPFCVFLWSRCRPTEYTERGHS